MEVPDTVPPQKKTHMTIRKSTMNEDVFPIKKYGDIPMSCQFCRGVTSGMTPILTLIEKNIQQIRRSIQIQDSRPSGAMVRRSP